MATELGCADLEKGGAQLYRVIRGAAKDQLLPEDRPQAMGLFVHSKTLLNKQMPQFIQSTLNP